MKYMLNVSVLSVVALMGMTVGASASSLNELDEGYLSIDTVQVREIPVAVDAFDGTVGDDSLIPGEIGSTIDMVDVLFDKVVNLGKKAWTIVEAGKPVVNVKTDTASALPQGLKDWQQLQGWQAPRVRAYEVVYKNLYGMTVVRFAYRVTFAYGGNHNGLGRYVANVAIVPSNVDVAWMYNFSAEAKISNVMNAGTLEDPMAAMQVNLDWRVNTVLKSSDMSASFYVRGDGMFRDLSNGN